MVQIIPSQRMTALLNEAAHALQWDHKGHYDNAAIYIIESLSVAFF